MSKVFFAKKTAAVIAAAMVVLSFAACSGKTDTASSQVSTAVSSVSSAASVVSKAESNASSSQSYVPEPETSAVKEKVFDISQGTIDNNLIGLWEMTNIPGKTYTFHDDNTLVISSKDHVLNRLYYLKDGKMYTAKDEYTEPEVHSYFLDGDSLRIGETENTSIYFRRGF